MIKQLSDNITLFLVQEDIVREDEIDVYSYGFEWLISIIANSAGMLIIAIVTESIIFLIGFVIGFMLMRAVSGGYHAKTHTSCLIASYSIYIANVVINHIIEIYANGMVLVIIAIISIIIIFIFAPIEHVNRRFKEGEYSTKQSIGEEELSQLEIDQMTLNTNINVAKMPSLTKMDQVEQIDIPKDAFKTLSEMTKIRGNIDLNTVVKSQSDLLSAIPDSIYKSGLLNEYCWGGNAENSKRYSYITYNFAGTDNRLTYLISFIAPDNTSKGNDNKEYDISIVISDNVQILYNVYNDELGVFDSRGQLKLKAEVSLQVNDNDADGVITRRQYSSKTYGKTNSEIYKLVIGYFPYVSDIGNISEAVYKTYTSGGEIETGDWLAFGDDFQEQTTLEQIMKKVEISDKYLYNDTDRINLLAKCDGISYNLISDWRVWVYQK